MFVPRVTKNYRENINDKEECEIWKCFNEQTKERENKKRSDAE